MSLKLKAVVTSGNATRIVEVDRARPDFATLKNEVQRKTKQQGQWYLRTNSNKPINNDAELLSAIVEGENSGAKNLDLTIVGGSAPRPAQPVQQQQARPAQPQQQQQYAQPAYSAQPSQPAYQPQQTYVHPTPTPQPSHSASVGAVNTSHGPGTFRVWTVQSVFGGEEKPKIVPEQTPSYYSFALAPCSQNVTIECFIEGTNQLKFKITLPSGSSMVQSFKMPFEIGCHLLEAYGDVTRLNFPF